MTLHLTERPIGHVTVVDLVGKLTIGENAQRFQEKIDSLKFQNRTQIVLNMRDVSYIDSGGLGQLIACYSSLAKTAGGLKLLHLGQRTHDLLSMTRLLTVFETFDSEAEAVGSFPALADA